MRAKTAPRWLGRKILHDQLRDIGLPFVAEAVVFKPSEFWLTYGERLEAVAVASAIVRGMQRRGIPVGDDLRAAAWRCTVAGLRELPFEEWPVNRQRVADQPLVIRRRGEGGRTHAK